MKVSKDSEANRTVIWDKGERGGGGGAAGNFKEEMGNSQVAGKVGNTFFPGTQNSGAEGDPVNRFWSVLPICPHLVPVC